MRKLTVHWALLSKETSSPHDYEITATSDPANRDTFAKILSEFTSGTSDRSALPRVSTSYFSENHSGRWIPMVGLSLQDSSGKLDGFRREFTTTTFVYAKWADFCKAQASYLSLYRAIDKAIDGAELSAIDARPLTLELEPYPVRRFGDSVTPLARQAAALLLTRQRICVTGTDHLPAETRPEIRLAFLDTVAALLPYGFRSSMAVSTWTNSTVQHQIKLSFAAVAPPWAAELPWSDEGLQVEPRIELPGDLPPEEQESAGALLARYAAYVHQLNDLKDRVLLERVIARLRTVVRPLSLKQQADLDDAPDLLVTAVVRAKKPLTPRLPAPQPRGMGALGIGIPRTEFPGTEFPGTESPGEEPGPPPPPAGAKPSKPDRSGAPHTVSLEDEVAAGLAHLRSGERHGLREAELACAGLSVTAADRLRARDSIRQHASAFQICPSMGLLPDATRFLHVILRLVYGEEPTAQDIDDLSADLEVSPCQPLIGVIESAFRPTAAGKILRTHFLYGNAVVRSFSPREVITALAEEPHERLLKIAPSVLRGADPAEVRELLEEHGYLIEVVESAARKSRLELYRLLLRTAYPQPLTTTDVESILAHTRYPPDCLIKAITDATDGRVAWGRVFARLGVEVAATAPRSKDPGAGGASWPGSLLVRTRAVVGSRGHQPLAWAGWCVAAVVTLLWIVTSLGNPSPSSDRTAATSSASSNVLSSRSASAPGPAGASAAGPPNGSPVASPNQAPPLKFPWPTFTAAQAARKRDSQLTNWIRVMNSIDCRAIGRFEPAKPEAGSVYKGLQAACESTGGGGDDRWAEAQRYADSWFGRRAGDCKDQLAAGVLEALLQTHQNHPELTIQLSPASHQTPIDCRSAPGAR